MTLTEAVCSYSIRSGGAAQARTLPTDRFAASAKGHLTNDEGTVLTTVRREHLQGNRVAKKLNPGQAGTKRLLRAHGDALVCVRYRYDRLKLYRFTTIELVIAAAPLHPRRFDIASFGIHVERGEQALRREIKAAGGRWDPGEGLWWLRGSLIRKLGLAHRICKT